MIEIRPMVPSTERTGIEALMIDHWKETELTVSSGKPDPQWHMYEAMEAEDMVIAYGAYENGEMIGYVVMFICPHIHYGWLYGQHDVLYVKPGYRESSAGLKMIRLAEQSAKERGAHRVFWHAKKNSVFASVMQKTRHPLEEEIYMKEF